MSYAQFGEDLIILNVLHGLGISQPTYLDVGAHHPIRCSNTALIYARGSRGVCVEPNLNLVPAFLELRPEDVTLAIGVGPAAGELDFFMIDERSGRNTFDRAAAEAFVAKRPEFKIRDMRRVPVLPLDEVVARHFDGRWPDLLSLDTEGLNLGILRASRLTAADGPAVVCAEAVSGGDDDQGAHLEALLAERGYMPVARTIGNIIWAARRSLSQKAA